jgi:kynurenine formamidase
VAIQQLNRLKEAEMRFMTVCLTMLLVGVEGRGLTPQADDRQTPEQLRQSRNEEIGEGRTQGYLTHLRAALEMIRPHRARQWYELSHPWSDTMPQNELAPPLSIDPLPTTRLAPSQGANIEQVSGAIAHAGTQLDALGHFGHLRIPDDAASAVYYNGFLQHEVKPTVDSPLLKLGMEKAAPIITTAVLLDAQEYLGHPLDAGEVITADHLKAMLISQRVRPILPGDVVLIRTGWERHWRDPDVDRIYFRGGPGLSEDAARFLAAKHVVAIGMDAAFIDPNPPPPRTSPPFIPFIVHHVALVEAGIHLIENMHLDELANDRVWVSAFMALPVRIVGASGSPVRPVAVGVPHR